MDEPEARYSLPAGEGDGAILGMAAGDSAGGAWELGYSAATEVATVIAYLLIEHGELPTDAVTLAVRELDGLDGEEPVYRAESRHLRSWLDRAAAGSTVPEEEPSIDPGSRVVPLGVAFRREPDELIRQVVGLETLFHVDARSILGGVVVASAVAASCFAQSGRDLIAGVAESVESAAELLAQTPGLIGVAEMETAPADIRELMPMVGITEGAEAVSAVGADRSAGPWDLLRAGLLVAAPVVERPHLPMEQAARIGGSSLGAAIGGIMGARVGIRAWPWAFANDTWFAEIGRRLVRGPSEVRDLPIPYAVEQHLITGERHGYH